MLSRKYRIIHRKEPLIAIEEVFPCTSFADEIRVLVDAPSRIHITLLDMNGASGRVDGGVGVALDEPGCVLDARKSADINVHGGDEAARNRVLEAARAVVEGLRLPGGAEITLHATARQHAGLGSGTQVALPRPPPSAGSTTGFLYLISRGSSAVADVRHRHGGVRAGRVYPGRRHRFGSRGKQDFRPRRHRGASHRRRSGTGSGGLAHPARYA